MGRRLDALAAGVAFSIALASCGDDAAVAPAGVAVSGTVLGQPFTTADASALVLAPSTCDFLDVGTPLSATGILLGFGSFEGLCSVATETQLCGDKANATIVTVLVARVDVGGGVAAPVEAGTYAISASTPAPDDEGQVTVAYALAGRTDAECATPDGTAYASGGAVRIDAIGARITGSVDLVFPDGGRVRGAFTAPGCAFQSDVCTLDADGDCDGPRTCVP